MRVGADFAADAQQKIQTLLLHIILRLHPQRDDLFLASSEA